MKTRAWRARAGTTLMELLIALTLFGVIVTLTLSVLDNQLRAFNEGTVQVDAQQSLRYTMSVLEKDLATVGINIANDQPFLVYVDTSVIVFNADHTSRVANDPFATYVDQSATEEIVSAVTRERRFTIPRSTFMYPDTSYRMGGQNSPAETITFYFEPDDATARPDDYRLLRKVNDQPAELIANGMLHLGGLPFFEYTRRYDPVSAPSYVAQVAVDSLPMRHSRPLHGVGPDTGAVAVIDKVRAVKVRFRVTDNRPGAKERIYSALRTIWFANAGMATKQTCGDTPILGTVGLSATRVLVGGQPAVQLSWSPSTDETGGEQDVIRYVIYRNTGPGPVGDPYLSIPAGNPAYSYTDSQVEVGRIYYYSIAAQDCSPSISDVFQATPVFVF